MVGASAARHGQVLGAGMAVDPAVRRQALFEEYQRAHRRWQIAHAIGATHETKSLLHALADSRALAFKRARAVELRP